MKNEANKEAEEGGLPIPCAWLHTMDNTEGLPENKPHIELTINESNPFGRSGIDYSSSFPVTSKPLFTAENIRQAIAADRASRQVANKAEVEPVAYMTSDKRMLAFADWVKQDFAYRSHGMVPLYATPPATTGASTSQRPTDDELWDATLRDRDAYHEWADKLADAIAKHFGVDIGEHSNHNLPWDEALQAIENAEPVGASTVLTDERIWKIWQDDSCPGGTVKEIAISHARAVLREVSAQAGQVAPPEGFVLVPVDAPSEMIVAIERAVDIQLQASGISPVHMVRLDGSEIFDAMLAAAPSPAKESK